MHTCMHADAPACMHRVSLGGAGYRVQGTGCEPRGSASADCCIAGGRPSARPSLGRLSRIIMGEEHSGSEEPNLPQHQMPISAAPRGEEGGGVRGEGERAADVVYGLGSGLC